MIAAIAVIALLTPFDDANWVSFGSAGTFAPNKTIHMLGEDVNITIYDDKIHVRVYFSFENRGPATTVKMAFPFESTVFSNEPTVREFRSFVDGEEVPVKKEPYATFTRDGRDFEKQGYKIARPFAYVKDVSFDKGQTRTVLVEYETAHGTVSDGNADEYVLHTGATWAGKIGLCTITVDWSSLKKTGKPELTFYRDDLSEFHSHWTALGRGKATTTITDFEPDFDLSIATSFK